MTKFPGQIFEFDPAKAASNRKKHGVTFTEAMTVFDDPLASTLLDDQHSLEENRFITETNSGIRLIGARAATAAERKQYEKGC
ncbi:MAG: BrnT family toxin [Edaphobacter sp.]